MTRFMPLRVKDDGKQLIVRSLNKISYFTKDGNFISEEKLKSAAEATMEWVKGAYVGMANEEKDGRFLINFNLYNKKRRN